MQKLWFSYLLVFFFAFLSSQDIQQKGLPFMQNYLPQDYGNHGKIWDIKSAKNGLVYMASEGGLLEFDGQLWNRFRNYKGYTRSLHIVNDSVIYVGADMDFGIYIKKNQKFSYQSLYPYRKNATGVTEEFWGTYQLRDKIIFVSHQNIYTYYNGKISKVKAPARFSESFFSDGSIFLTDDKQGLLRFDGEILTPVFPNPGNSSFEISGIFKNHNQLNIITKNQGIFVFADGKLSPVTSDVTPYIIRNKVFSFTVIDNKFLAFGTVIDGVYITDLNGKIIQHINKSNGLPNNTILTLDYQKNGKLWLGLDYGISCIDIKSNISYFYSNNGDFGTGYTAFLEGNNFYLGSNQGLYIAGWNNLGNGHEDTFSLMKGSEGQVWSLQSIDGKIYCGHDKGLFTIQDQTFKKINDEYGVSQMTPFRKDYILTGHYNGISIYKKDNNGLSFIRKMPLILGAVSQIVIENDRTIWINIPNYGIIRTDVDSNLNPVNRKIFLDTTFKGNFAHLYRKNKIIQICTNSSTYNFDTKTRKFNLAGNNVNPSFIKNGLPGFYFPKKISEDYNFYPVYNGFAIEKNQTKKSEILSALLFRKVYAFNNHSEKLLDQQQTVSYNYNNLGFSFTVPNEDGIEYQVFLKGFSDHWTDWSPKTESYFLNLKEGSYTLLVRARKGNSAIKTQQFEIKIKAPWYRSIYSYILYFITVWMIIYLIRRYNKNKLKKQALDLLQKQRNSLRIQAEKHRDEMMMQKQMQMEKEQQNLREEIRRKTIELATKAKDDEDKNRILSSINSKIKEMEDSPNTLKIKLGEIRRMLKQYLHTEDHTFEIQMDELHQEFFKGMKAKFPNLSIYELRLCAYLRIGLNSKEMAEIFQVLPSSINVSRSRLRKKLGLKPEDDLYDFLNDFNI